MTSRTIFKPSSLAPASSSNMGEAPKFIMQLFHVSRDQHGPGASIGGYSSSLFIDFRMSDPEYAKLECAFEAARPAPCSTRKNAVFAFDSLDACSSFWDAERRFGTRPNDYSCTPHYYLVEMPSPTRAPIPLVGHAYKRLQCGLPYAEILAEYWSPTRDWQSWEFLAPAGNVVEVLAAPMDSIAVSARISDGMADRALMRRLWPI